MNMAKALKAERKRNVDLNLVLKANAVGAVRKKPAAIKVRKKRASCDIHDSASSRLQQLKIAFAVGSPTISELSRLDSHGL